MGAPSRRTQSGLRSMLVQQRSRSSRSSSSTFTPRLSSAELGTRERTRYRVGSFGAVPPTMSKTPCSVRNQRRLRSERRTHAAFSESLVRGIVVSRTHSPSTATVTVPSPSTVAHMDDSSPGTASTLAPRRIVARWRGRIGGTVTERPRNPPAPRPCSVDGCS